jgi:hypothetical protein
MNSNEIISATISGTEQNDMMIVNKRSAIISCTGYEPHLSTDKTTIFYVVNKSISVSI